MTEGELTVDLVIITYNRSQWIDRLLTQVLDRAWNWHNIIILNNGSTDDTDQVLEKYASDPRLTIIRSEENLGAPGGRNFALANRGTKVAGDILFFIDDDADFITEDDPTPELQRRFTDRPDLAALAVKVVNADAGKVIAREFPTDHPDRDQDREMDVSYFPEGGVAIRRAALDRLGGFDAGLFYAHEGLDWCFRAIQQNWVIAYSPVVAVRHYKTPDGRMAQPDIVRRALLNRLVIAHKFLPLRYRIVGGVLWIAKALLWGRSPRLVLSALRQYLMVRAAIPERRLSKDALRYLRQNHGRLWY